jgi:hypothetical protein
MKWQPIDPDQPLRGEFLIGYRGANDKSYHHKCAHLAGKIYFIEGRGNIPWRELCQTYSQFLVIPQCE